MGKKKWRWIFLGICIFLGGVLLLSVRVVTGPFLLGFVLAYLLSPFVEILEKKGLGRRTAIAVVFLGIFGVLGGSLALALPILYSELAKITLVLPQTMQDMDHYIQGFREQYRASGLPSRVALVFDQHLGQGEEFMAGKLEWFLRTLPEMLASLSLYILSPVLAIYFLADWTRLHNAFQSLVPQRWRLDWQRLWQDINHIVRRFVRGNLVVAAIVGVLIGIGVKLLGMEYAFLIGLICGVSDLIPYFGPLIGAVPSLLLALIQSPVMAMKVAFVILFVQQLEGNIISPKLMGESVRLHPLWIVFALLSGGELAGLWGMLISVPLAAVIRIILRHIYLRLVSPEV
ncbi:MAG: AI-2E family transporter [Desulfitobacteriaceae bacterium]